MKHLMILLHRPFVGFEADLLGVLRLSYDYAFERGYITQPPLSVSQTGDGVIMSVLELADEQSREQSLLDPRSQDLVAQILRVADRVTLRSVAEANLSHPEFMVIDFEAVKPQAITHAAPLPLPYEASDEFFF